MHRDNILELIKDKSATYLILLGIGYGLSATMFLNILYIINANMMTIYAEKLSEITEGGSFLGRVVFICLVGPVIEELLYRGVIFRVLKRFSPYIWANLIQAAIFGISHYNPIQAIYSIILGVILGYVYNKYQTIVAPILVHIGFNISGFLLPYLLTMYVITKIKNIWILCLIIIFILCFGFFLFGKCFGEIGKEDLYFRMQRMNHLKK